jgi:hypothetical protein
MKTDGRKSRGNMWTKKCKKCQAIRNEEIGNKRI